MLSTNEIETLRKIEIYITEKFKDNNVSSNEIVDGELLNELSDFFKFEILGLCGCGCVNSTVKVVRDYLNIVKVRHSKDFNTGGKRTLESFNVAHKMMEETFGYNSVSDNGLLQYMAYDLDDRELTEHGTSIDGCWITVLGKICLYVFDLYVREHDDDKESGD